MDEKVIKQNISGGPVSLLPFSPGLIRVKTIRSFGRQIYKNELTVEDALEEQIKFKNEIDKFVKESTKA